MSEMIPHHDSNELSVFLLDGPIFELKFNRSTDEFYFIYVWFDAVDNVFETREEPQAPSANL